MIGVGLKETSNLKPVLERSLCAMRGPLLREVVFSEGIGGERELHIPSCFSTTSLSPARVPAACIASGSIVVFHTDDAVYESLSRCTGDLGLQSLEEINAVTGPLAIEGAMPGDALSVEVLDVSIQRCWSVWTANEAVSGCLACKLAATGRHTCVRQLDIDDAGTYVQISGRLRVPLEPMIGCIGTSPAPHDTCDYGCGCSTFEPTFPHGGNMDLRELSRGSSILLPVQNEGGLLFVGDLHACMV